MGRRVLVTDADQPAALQVIRSLGRAGYRVEACEGRAAAAVPLGFRSRHCAARHWLPHRSLDAPEAHARDLLDLVVQVRPDILVPVSIASVEWVAIRKTEFGALTTFLLPDSDSIARAKRKDLLVEVARSAGVPVPATRIVENEDGLREVGREAVFPIILKRAEEGAFKPAGRYRIVRGPRDLDAAWRALASPGLPVVAQQLVDGVGVGYFALFGASGAVMAEFGHRRIREYPVSGGPSSMCEAFRSDELFRLGAKILSALGWRGVAMAEFRMDPASGKLWLLEVNPRFWGSLPLACAAGVDFPLLLARAAAGEGFEKPAFDVSARMRYLHLDLQAALEHVRRGTARVAGEVILDLFDLRVREGILSWEDPSPGLAYLAGLRERRGG